MQRRRVKERLHAVQYRQHGADREAERVEHRQEVQHHVLRIEIDHRFELFQVAQDIRIR